MTSLQIVGGAGHARETGAEYVWVISYSDNVENGIPGPGFVHEVFAADAFPDQQTAERYASDKGKDGGYSAERWPVRKATEVGN